MYPDINIESDTENNLTINQKVSINKIIKVIKEFLNCDIKITLIKLI